MGLKDSSKKIRRCCNVLKFHKYIKPCKTGVNDVKIQTYWHEKIAMEAYRIAIAINTARGGFGAGCKTFLIGQKSFREQWADCKCTRYICIEPFKNLDEEFCYSIEGTEEWHMKRSDFIEEKVCVNPWDNIADTNRSPINNKETLN